MTSPILYTPEYEARMRATLSPGEIMYPILTVDVRWSAEYKPDDKRYPPRPTLPPLPENRYWDSTGWDELHKDEDSAPVILRLQQEWWPELAKKRLNPADVTISVTLKGHDVWCAGWFSHYTFDVGMDDLAVLTSFEWYIDRVQRSGLTHDQIDGILMGAEDNWRWHGTVDGTPQGERTDPPCRCPHCKARGLVRIDH